VTLGKGVLFWEIGRPFGKKYFLFSFFLRDDIVVNYLFSSNLSGQYFYSIFDI
jgi:hypothetical protein